MVLVLTMIFAVTSFLVIYPYLIYPILLRVLAKWSPMKRNMEYSSRELPRLTIVISAFNEETIIGPKLANALESDYPEDLLEIIVASDASSDDTDDIVRSIGDRTGRVKLVRQPERRGKSAALNQAVASAAGQIIVFSDANSMYERNALKELVGCFSDPVVGYAVGAALYSDVEKGRSGEGEGLYWQFELALKRMESDVHSVVGGDGAIYALRRELFRTLEDDDISDFVNPLQVVAAGYRGVFNPKARCYEASGETLQREFRRKRRIVNRAWRAVRRYGHLLKPGAHGRFIFMLVSHKVIRWYALPLIFLAWLTNWGLVGQGGLYPWTWFLINGSVAVAALGALLDRLGRPQPRVVSILYYFYGINLAGFLGLWDEWRGVRHVTWDHIRTAGR